MPPSEVESDNARRQLHFTRRNDDIDDTIDTLIRKAGGIRRPEIVRELVIAALKAGQEDDQRVDLKLMNTTLKEMRFTAKVFSPYRSIKKVSVFGSARLQPDHPLYAMARGLGRELAAAGFMVITGGGPGVMQAVNEGAGPEHSFGVNIRLPFEQQPNPIIRNHPRLVNYKYFFNRKVAFLKEAHAVVLFPGGFGTLDEGMETLTLLQTGKRDPIPLIMIERPGDQYWEKWIDFLREELLEQQMIHSDDLLLFERVTTVDAAVRQIKHFYRRYHSLRFVGDKLVVRLAEKIDPAFLESLRSEFGNLLVPGGAMVLSAALPEERDQPALAHLPRLVMDFDRRRFGQLRQFIAALNQ